MHQILDNHCEHKCLAWARYYLISCQHKIITCDPYLMWRRYEITLCSCARKSLCRADKIKNIYLSQDFWDSVENKYIRESVWMCCEPPSSWGRTTLSITNMELLDYSSDSRSTIRVHTESLLFTQAFISSVNGPGAALTSTLSWKPATH